MSLPPTGTITFLFTDIEGSTRLWESGPDAMRPALACHDALLRRSIEDNGGFVFKTVGDAFCAVFPTAPAALAATLKAQLALAAETWDTETPLRVRMALHTGAAEERGGDYFGQTLNRVARLMATGHGGQTLLSDVTQGLVMDGLPPQASLLDIGLHRLKDLGRPTQVFQLLHPRLPTEFPPLKSLSNPALPNNLPQQTTSFIGRAKQIADAKALLGAARLLTLTGPGGSGKTRLSLQVAADLLDGEGDGVWLVELAALRDPALVPQAVADVLSIKEQAGKPIHQTLAAALKPKRLLIVLDNCEHLIAACASLAADLLRNCPEVHLLASSREALNVSGEQTYRLPPLSLPDPKKPQTAESLSQFEAVRLFLERAQSVHSAFILTDTNAPAVAQVCWRLDGIPLALELAAARIRSLSVEEINTRLDNRFRLLTGGSRSALPRQQTLRALVDWSYDLLSDQEKRLLRRLSVFAGGWTLAAAGAVCAGEDRDEFEVIDLLTGLVDKSMAVYEEDKSESRYRLLETIRQYAGDRLAEAWETESVQRRAAAWFMALAEQAMPHLKGSEQAAWLARLEAEHDNLRASLSWYQSRSEQFKNEQFGNEQASTPRQELALRETLDPVDGGLRLAGALSRFWYVCGYFSEGRQWLEQALAARNEATPAARTRALAGAGTLAYMLGNYAEARALNEEALTGARQSRDQPGVATALNNLGLVASSQGDYTGARVLYEECLVIHRKRGDQWGTALALTNLGFVALRQGDFTEAKTLNEEGLTLQRKLGDQKGIADTLGNLGMAAIQQGDFPGARALYEESLSMQRTLGNQQGVANMLGNLGMVAAEQGDYPSARALLEESLPLSRKLGNQHWAAYALAGLGEITFRQGGYAESQSLYAESLLTLQQVGDVSGMTECLEGMAGVAHRQGSLFRAARLWGASAGMRETIGSPLATAKQAEKDAAIAAMHLAIGEDAFIVAYAGGRAMAVEQAVEFALSGTAGVGSGSREDDQWYTTKSGISRA